MADAVGEPSGASRPAFVRVTLKHTFSYKVLLLQLISDKNSRFSIYSAF